MAKILTATIDPATGEMEVDLSGYKGKGCHAVQEAISKAMGSTTIEDKRKREYNDVEVSKVCVRS